MVIFHCFIASNVCGVAYINVEIKKGFWKYFFNVMGRRPTQEH